jgi:hypothetical protein
VVPWWSDVIKARKSQAMSTLPATFPALSEPAVTFDPAAFDPADFTVPR